MLTNIVRPDANSNPDVFNRLIPSPSIRSIRNVRDVWSLPSPRILTSHSSYLPGLPRVVYLVRDGRDALVSYYHYVVHRQSRLKGSDVLQLDFPGFFERYYQGHYRYIWHLHLESWLVRGKASLGDRMLVVRFEDMKKDPQAIVSEVARFAHLSASPGLVASAVQKADLANMRQVEKQRWQAKGLGTPDETSSFYRSGQSKKWQAYFTSKLLDRFLSCSAKAMQLAGYHS